MLPTLFHIPKYIGEVPVFGDHGVGLLLALWAVGSVLLLGWLLWRQGSCADTWSNVPLLLVIGAVIWQLLPHLTDDRGLPIRSYGVMVLVGTVLATLLAIRRGRPRGFSSDTILSMGFWMFLPGVVGARLFYVVHFWDEFQQPTTSETLVRIVNIAEGGLVIYGALLGGFVGLAAYLYRYRLPWLRTFDMLAPAVMLGLALGRVGCMLNGCCYGAECELPWAVRFPVDSPVYVHEQEAGRIYLHGLKITGKPDAAPRITAVEEGSLAEQHGLKAGQTITALDGLPVPSVRAAQEMLRLAMRRGPQLQVATADGPAEVAFAISPAAGSLPVHPTQIYSALNALLICLFLLAVDPFCRREGALFAWILTLYPLTRFIIEAIRTDEEPVLGTGLSIAQVVSLVLLLVAAGAWVYVWRRAPERKRAAAT